MAAVDHQRARQLRGLDLAAGRGDRRGVVVRRLAAAQDDVAVLVAAGLDDRDLAVLVHREEVVRPGGGLDGVDRDPDVAVGAVLEADRRRQARGQLAVHLALGGARADRAPGDQVAEVLRRDHVEELAARRHAEPVDLEQQLAADAQALVDAIALVEVGVVDQALPADGGARLLEVDAHHDLERAGEAVALALELLRVLDGGERIVDRARPHDHQQAVVLALHDPADRAAGRADLLLDRRAGDREEPDQVLRRRQGRHVLDPQVVGLAGAFAVGIRTLEAVAALHHDGFPSAKKKTAGGCPAVLEFGCAVLAYAIASPSAERCENAKYA